MKLFNRKKDTSTPNEIQNYYTEERRDRTGVAWLLAAGTLIVTLLLALGLFYGGRWAYRTVFDDGGDAPAGITQEENVSDGAFDDSTIDDSEATDEEEQASTSNADGTGDSEADQNDSDESSVDENSDGDQSSSSENLPASGPQTLPSTGPSEPEL